MELLVAEALTLGCSHVQARVHEPWSVVSADLDWFNVPARVPASEDELFARLLAFPEAGDNSCRAEVLIAAFAHDVITGSRGSTRVVQGQVSADDAIYSVLGQTSTERFVAFRGIMASS
jgi:hypothetical protein